jgi:hypothetical protein
MTQANKLLSAVALAVWLAAAIGPAAAQSRGHSL